MSDIVEAFKLTARALTEHQHALIEHDLDLDLIVASIEALVESVERLSSEIFKLNERLFVYAKLSIDHEERLIKLEATAPREVAASRNWWKTTVPTLLDDVVHDHYDLGGEG